MKIPLPRYKPVDSFSYDYSRDYLIIRCLLVVVVSSLLLAVYSVYEYLA